MSHRVGPGSAEDEFAETYGESLSRVLDLGTWHSGADLAQLYASLHETVAECVEQERRARDPIRRTVFRRLGAGLDTHAPASAGLYKISPEEVAEIHSGLLFNGATECCDGTMVAHDSLLLSVIQIGVSLVAYQGSQGTWVHRLYRRDLRTRYRDPVEEAMALLERRASRSDGREGPTSELERRALMEYAERAALTYLSQTPWRMGHGNPVPLTLLVPTSPELVRQSLDVLRRLILDHRRFVYVASSPASRLMLTLGNALHPLEFAIVETLGAQLNVDQLTASQRGHRAETELIQQFVKEVGPQVVAGIFRAGRDAPARVFYAHQEFACEAAGLAIADSVLQPWRGFPMLIDLADLHCRNTFDGGSFNGTLQDAYAAAGEPTRYLSERETRS
jgi:hypothetical protein